MTGSQDTSTGTTSTYEPSVADVLVVKCMLTKSLNLPPEIIDTIVDLAEYWPHTTTEALFNGSCEARGNHIRGQAGIENKFLLRTPPLGLRPDNWNLSSPDTEPPLNRWPVRPRPLGTEFAPDDFQTLTAAPAPLLAHPCRRIVFTIKSRDQGWGGDFQDRGTYKHSWTWFEAGLERWYKPNTTTNSPATASQNPQKLSLAIQDLRTVIPPVQADPDGNSELTFHHPLAANDDLLIQSNASADRNMKEHRVVWSYDDSIDPENVEAASKLEEVGRGKATGNGKFVRELKLGDVVTVWAKARFPGWANFVDSVKIEVYYAV